MSNGAGNKGATQANKKKYDEGEIGVARDLYDTAKTAEGGLLYPEGIYDHLRNGHAVLGNGKPDVRVLFSPNEKRSINDLEQEVDGVLKAASQRARDHTFQFMKQNNKPGEQEARERANNKTNAMIMMQHLKDCDSNFIGPNTGDTVKKIGDLLKAAGLSGVKDIMQLGSDVAAESIYSSIQANARKGSECNQRQVQRR